MPRLTGSVADPEFRRARATKAAEARNHPRSYARSIVAAWPELDPEIRAELRGMLAPIVARAENGAGQ